MQKYTFNSAHELLELTKKYSTSISDIVINYSAQEKNCSKNEIIKNMENRVKIMKDSIEKGLKIDTRSKYGLSGGDAKKLDEYKPKVNIIGKTELTAIKYAFAIMEHNARFGRIVAFPTAGSAGTVPASIIATAEAISASDKKLIESLFCAGAIGMITGHNAMLAGASGGCQAEVGTAAAMAAAGLCELQDGTPEQCLNAASICLKGMLGLVCDPIGGLVEAPCVKRNATGVANAFMACEVSLAGIKSNVDFDQVLVAMNNIAKLMACELKETAKGGLAITKVGQEVWQKIQSDN